MFGFISDTIESTFNSASETIDDFIEDPVGTSVDMALSPVHNTIDILEGLSEGELRAIAVARLGADVACGMALSEIIDTLGE